MFFYWDTRWLCSMLRHARLTRVQRAMNKVPLPPPPIPVTRPDAGTVTRGGSHHSSVPAPAGATPETGTSAVGPWTLANCLPPTVCKEEGCCSPAQGLPQRPCAARSSCDTTAVGQSFSCIAPPFNVLLPPWSHPASGCHWLPACSSPGNCVTGQAERHPHTSRSASFTGQEQMSQHTEPPERKPPPLGGGDAHQEVRSSQTLLPELREEDEEEDEESVLLSLLLLFGPLRLPLLLLLLVDVSLWRCRDRLRLVVARLEGFQPRRRGDLR